VSESNVKESCVRACIVRTLIRGEKMKKGGERRGSEMMMKRKREGEIEEIRRIKRGEISECEERDLRIKYTNNFGYCEECCEVVYSYDETIYLRTGREERGIRGGGCEKCGRQCCEGCLKGSKFKMCVGCDTEFCEGCLKGERCDGIEYRYIELERGLMILQQTIEN